MASTQAKKLEDLQLNAEKYIQEMVEMSDKKLSKNLDIVRKQIEMIQNLDFVIDKAQVVKKPVNDETLALLQEMESHIIEARTRKF